MDFDHLAKELGDILWYVAETATAIGFDLDTIMQMNIDKLKARYPDGFSAEKSMHRKDGDV
jgi:NTP pyrophosphatase (non-canonical NTP hydrolase)